MSAADLARVEAHLKEALKQSRHLQEMVTRSHAQPQDMPHAMPRGAEQSAAHSDTGATTQQPQTSREGLELSAALEQARQQIIKLQQVLSRFATHTFLLLYLLRSD